MLGLFGIVFALDLAEYCDSVLQTATLQQHRTELRLKGSVFYLRGMHTRLCMQGLKGKLAWPTSEKKSQPMKSWKVQ